MTTMVHATPDTAADAVAATPSPVTAAATTPTIPAGAGALLPVYKRVPVTFVRGKGVELFDAAGRAYLDFASGIAVNALGYGDAGLERAMHDAIASGLVHTSNLYHTEPAAALAARLVELSFADKVFFCNSGAEAVEGSFKIARKWARRGGESPAKHEIVALRGSFHGRLFASLAATDRPAYRLPFRPLAPGVGIVERDIEDLEVAISAETTAAVILEPVQGEGGVRVLDAGFVRAVRELTRERGVALILDEIQCGLGRTGTLFAHERLGIVPDMVTLAKPLAGGLPMGAVLMTQDIASAMSYGDHGTTFGGGPFVATVAGHVIDRLADPALLAHVTENGAWMGARLREMAARTSQVRDVRGTGYMWGVDVTGPASAVVAKALEAGLLVITAGDHTLRLLPPLVATRAELARGLATLEAAIVAAAQA
jgi:predicted acetylornithine/succinylornithine family transaminase